MTTEMKFDNYFMYAIDNMGGQGNGAPPCGPMDGNFCAEYTNGEANCCTHVVMTDEGSGE